MTHAENYAAIIAAWVNPGPQPRYHRAMQREVHRAMPVLAAALERAYLDAIRRRPAPLEGVATVDKDMIERGARAFYEHPTPGVDASLRPNWDRLVAASPDVADNYRRHMTAALNAVHSCP